MRIVVTTVYEGVDQVFINDFVDKMKKASTQPAEILALNSFLSDGEGQVLRQNPEDPHQTVTTTWRSFYDQPYIHKSNG